FLGTTSTTDRTFTTQIRGAIDLSFEAGSLVNGSLQSIAVQPDGKVVVGGNFTSINGTARNYIAQLNANGTLNTSFDSGTGANGAVTAVALQSDGRVLVGGSFTTINGTARNYIARLNADGNLDTSFDPGTGMNGKVTAVALQSDGRILVGGSFTTINGTARNYIARLNADGSLDTSFDPGTGANGSVLSVALQSDGKVLLGGDFTTIDGTARNYIARLNADGSLDTSFDPWTGPNGSVLAITPQNDGMVVLGGDFTTINGAARSRIARLKADGSLDTSFTPGTGANGPVIALALQSDGAVLVGGDFTTMDGTSRNRLARLNTDGSLDTRFDPGTGANNTVNALALQSDGRVLLGGLFTSFNDTARSYVERLDNDAATQSLSATRVTSASRVEWLRGGASPEVEQVSFELSTDSGATWSLLGAGTRISGGWERTGLNLPVVGLLRATARTAGGQYNGSSGLVQTTAGFFLPLAPTVTTSAATSITGSGATLVGSVNANGLATTAYFEYGLTSAYGSTASVTLSPADGTNAQSVSVILNGLQAVTTYSYRLVAVNSQGTAITSNGTFTTTSAQAQTAGAADLSFETGSFVNGSVQVIAVQTDGKVLIGGNFTAVRGAERNRIARLNADGSVDASFDPGTGADGLVTSIALQSDGKVVVGGTFTTINGTARNYIARLNANGSLDTSFNPGTGASSIVYSVAVQSDGKVFVAGAFTTINGATRNYIARLHADGSVDASFDPGTGANSAVYSLALQLDGKVLVGGTFTTINGAAANYMARLNADGSLDASFDPGTGANNWVYSLALQLDGKVLVGGNFTTINGATRNRIARLNADGSLDTSFDPGTGANNRVSILALQPDGKVLVGGNFTTINGTTSNRLARLNADGSLDVTFTGTGANGEVYSLALQSDGKVLVGGAFTTINGITRNYIARLNADGSLDTSFDPRTGANNWVYSVALQPDGKVLEGGNFTTINGITRNYIARLNADGSLDTGFDPGIGANSAVYSIAMQSDGKVLVGGAFTTFNGMARSRIARLNANGSLDTSFDPGTGASGAVYSIAVQSDGRVFVGGDFTTFNGTTRNIARLSANGSLDLSFTAGIPIGNIYSLAVQRDGKVLVGGLFTINFIDGTKRNHIARLNADGSLDLTYGGSGANFSVYALALQPDGKVLIGGEFTNINGAGRNRIARLTTNGGVDASFDPGTGANSVV
ncbi:MAG: hypothetical protein EOO11_15580, partial [Chitinophagaceae bacterium]